MGDKGRQDPPEADTPSNKGQRMRQRETRPSGRRTHHPSKANKKGYNGTRGGKTLGKADTPSNQGKQGYNGRRSETKGDKTFGKADPPSNKGNQERAQWETKEDKTLAKADTPSN